jgi:hypothetical protein
MKFLLLLAFISISAITLGQEKSLMAIKLVNGNEYVGIIEKDDGREIYVMTQSIGGIFLLKTEIQSIKPINGETQVVQGEIRDTGPFTTRYAFTTNALSIKKGENYAMLNLYGPEIHMAVSNRLSVGLMSTWIGSPLVLALKYTIPTKRPNLNFSFGNLTATSGYLQSFRGFGNLAFANMTFGNRLNNVTIAAGYFAYRGGGKDNFNKEASITNDNYATDFNDYQGLPKPVHGPMLSLGGIARIGAKASFVFDSMVGFFEHEYGELTTTTLREPNYSPLPVYDPGEYRHDIVLKQSNSTFFFIMPGMRFQREERKAFQFCLSGLVINDSGDLVSVPFPMCTWFYRF